MCTKEGGCPVISDSCVTRVPVFSNLEQEDLRLVTAIIQTSSLPKGSYVFREGERSDSLYIVKQGLIKLTTFSPAGKEHILRFLFPGDFLGQYALFQEKQHYASAEVMEPSAICRLSKQDIMPLLETHPRLSFNFLLALSEQIQQADDWAGALHVMDTEQRLAKLLLHYRAKQNPEVEQVVLPAAKKELSAMIGTSPETLSRKLAKWVDDGIIRMDNRTIRILDPGRFGKMAY